MNNKRPSYNSGNSKGFRSFVPGTGGKDQIYIFYNATAVNTHFQHFLLLTPGLT